jgi:predicted alpha-1,2-mannosidase
LKVLLLDFPLLNCPDEKERRTRRTAILPIFTANISSMRKTFSLIAALMGLSVLTLVAQTGIDLTQYVNPLAGTYKMGHTFPGASMPFGFVQLSPDTDTISYELNGKYNGEVYRYCAGYQYDDPTIVGFSHTHFSGTGHSDLGDFLVMPTTGPLKINPGTADKPGSGYRSRFSHSTETAEPGYYSVMLDDYGIRAELTATTRVGIHRYTFPKAGTAHILLDLIAGIYNFPEKDVWTFLRVENDTLITGYRQTTGWARTRTVYFAMAFSKPVSHYGQKKYDNYVYKGFWRKFDETHDFPEMAGRKIRTWFDFEVKEGEAVMVKFALSPVSTEGAVKNLQSEAPGWDFDAYRKASREAWNRELGKIRVETMNEEQKRVFYTALYHAFLSPATFMDVDGQYRGLDQNNHKADGFTNYTIFSLWDTYRALHPLYNIIQPKRNGDMARSMMAHFDQSAEKMLPVWSHYANENWCMIGYHSVPVIVDAYLKGNLNMDPKHILNAITTTATNGWYDGLDDYMKMGYVPEDKSGSSVSKTLEYAYDDWCIAQFAKKIGDESVYGQFSKRSENYHNVFDPKTGYMRPKLSDGSWKPGFDPLSTHNQGFIEGNAWNYSLYVPHQVDEMIRMMGGNKIFVRHLDSLFTMHLDDSFFAETEDITRDGLIGNYVHGNEPSHHVAYLYNWAGAPEKTQERVRMIMDKMYHDAPDGLCGNDDAGQMSAWYIFSALGFYPVCPGSDQYAIGSPLVTSASLHLENGKTLEIEVQNQSPKNVHIRKVLVNGKEINRNYLTYSEITNGGKITFIMKK